MKKFIHHGYFEKVKAIQTYRFPFVCLSCCKSFKYPRCDQGRRCPQCGIPMEKLSRKFSAPPSKDKQQWKKVEFLVRNGFRFYTVFETLAPGVLMPVKYPDSLQEAAEFVKKYKAQAIQSE